MLLRGREVPNDEETVVAVEVKSSLLLLPLSLLLLLSKEKVVVDGTEKEVVDGTEKEIGACFLSSSLEPPTDPPDAAF